MIGSWTDGAQGTFRLLDLPKELWSEIGKMAVDNHASLHFGESCCFYVVDNGETRRSRDGRVSNIPPVTQTCAAMREELLSYYYVTKVDINVILRTSLGGEGRRLAHWLRSIEPRMLHHFKSIRIADVIQDQTVLQTGRSARSRIIDLARRHCYGNDMLRLAKRNRLHCPQFEDEQHIAASCPTTYRFTHFVRLLVQRPFDVVLEDEDKTAGYYQHRIVFPKPLED